MPRLPNERPAGKTARILIADDDPAMRELLTGLVINLGYQAQAVPDGEAAVAAVTAQPPDLLLSDVSMPGLTGFDLCRRLKADPATRLIPVVLITGIGEDHKIEGIEAGADDFLAKPFSQGELRARIRALLRLKAFIDELEHAEAVLCTLGRSIEAKDPYTEGHCERLADYAVALGHSLGLGEEELRALRLGGHLHDLGKLGVPDAILLKPGPLTAAEREVMRRHPFVGEEICRPLRSLQTVLPIIRSHHERQDGSGYPDGLRGEAVPLTARILQVVDVYDALTTDRPYRRAMGQMAALEMLDAEARQGWWDSLVVRTFRHVMSGAYPLKRGGSAMTPRVLVVEDNPVNMDLATALLEEGGYEVLCAETAGAGLRLAAAERPALILMDLQLPGMTGYEATQRLKADPATAAIPVVAVTAQAMRGAEAEAREAGCDGYLTKPLDAQVFRDTLRRFLPPSDKGTE